MKLTVYDQQGATVCALSLFPGWNDLGYFGLHRLPDDTLMILNAIDRDGAGDFYFGRIVIEADKPITCPPRPGWFIEGNKLTIGQGRECLPAQSCLTVRTYWDASKRAPGPFRMHGVDLPMAYIDDGTIEHNFLEALRTGQPERYAGKLGGLAPRLPETGCGIWRPAGKALPDTANGGGYGIEPHSGYERSAVLAMIAHDLTAERHRVWCVRATDGLPVARPKTYGAYDGSRGWKISTKLPRFTFRASIGTDDVTPRKQNEGVCDYLARLTAFGDQQWSGFPEVDHQHLIRATRYAKAAKFIWGDAAASLFLDMVAAEALYPFIAGFPSLGDFGGGKGSDVIGLRAWDWQIDALVAAGRKEAANMVQLAASAQMKNGQVMRMSFGKGWAPNPGPWEVSPSIPRPLDPSVDVSASMEAVFMAHGFIIGRHPRNAQLLLERQLDYGRAHGGIPKFLAVGKRGGPVARDLIDGTGDPDYFGALAIGEGAWAFGKSFLTRYLTSVPTPSQGMCTSISDAHGRLAREEIGRPQCVAWMSAVESQS